MSELANLPSIVVVVASLIASVTDVCRFKVYNALTFPLLAAAFVYHGAVVGWPALLASIAGALFGFAILVIPYVSGGMGAGDVKFLTGIGAWLGVESLSIVVLVGFLATGLYALVLSVANRNLREMWTNLQIVILRHLAIVSSLRAGDNFESVQSLAQQPDRKRRLVPISAMMAVGVVVTLILTYLDELASLDLGNSI